MLANEALIGPAKRHSTFISLHSYEFESCPEVLDALRQNQRARKVDISECVLKDERVLSMLGLCRQLESICIRSNGADIDWKAFAQHVPSSCTCLRVCAPSLSPSDAQQLLSIPTLQCIDLFVFNEVEVLSKCRFPSSITRLNCGRTLDLAHTCAIVSTFPHLRSLVARASGVADKIMPRFSNLRELNCLSLEDTWYSISCVSLRSIATNCPLVSLNLRRLQSGWGTVLSRSPLASSLIRFSFEFDAQQYSATDMMALASVSTLRSLRIDCLKGKLPSEVFSAIGLMSSLVELGVSMSVASYSLADLQIMKRHLLGLPSLVSFEFADRFVPDVADPTPSDRYSYLASIPSLTAMTAYGMLMTLSAWQMFGRHPHLQRFAIISTSQEGANALYLSPSRSLTEVTLFAYYMPTELHHMLARNRRLFHNWCCIAILIANARANASNALRDSLLYEIDNVMHFLDGEHLQIESWRRFKTAKTASTKKKPAPQLIKTIARASVRV
eukprot:TRINITY_DN2321_c0_g1_i1.p1 TRINITY_DN2321_c0_g1~~TRINITY_DN2321_c0_g1_i1.p1  ORF type:complete len:500 (-),score=83.32 TRINITY_DN2321_c0_g1_i1:247-1746(-)